MVAKNGHNGGRGKIIEPCTIAHARPPTYSNKFASLTDNPKDIYIYNFTSYYRLNNTIPCNNI